MICHALEALLSQVSIERSFSLIDANVAVGEGALQPLAAAFFLT